MNTLNRTQKSYLRGFSRNFKYVSWADVQKALALQ